MSGDNGHAGDAAQASGHDPKTLLGRMVGGKYRVERVLGRGGMGTIYVAEQQPLGRRVALKILHPALGDGDADPEFAKRFLLEAATLSQLAHPNIVVVHDYGSLEDAGLACFMVMEFIEGRTINEALSQDGRFPASRALRITREIARALRAAHGMGVIHRDLKPSNVMLAAGAEGESVKVLDFGLVKVQRDDVEELTAEGRFLGSPRYMSPEQIQRLPMDGRADLYSLGVLLYRMLCREAPFGGEQAVQTLMAHLTKPVPPMAERGGIGVPPAVEQIARKLLEKDPDHRYADATELIRAIDAAWSELSEEPLLVSGEHARQGAVITSGEHSSTSGSLPQVVMPTAAPEPVTVVYPVAAAPRPESALEDRRRWVFPVIVTVGLALGLGSAAALATFLDDDASDPPATEPRETAGPDLADPEPPPVVSPDPPIEPPPAPVPRSRFTLTVRSVPPGASLMRDGAEVGLTPIDVELDSQALAAAPARFELRMRGRESVSFEQGASSADVDLERALPLLSRRQRPPRPPDTPDPPRGGGDQSIKIRR